jgi:UPF0716 family protein affecting phage T7 exclusion
MQRKHAFFLTVAFLPVSILLIVLVGMTIGPGWYLILWPVLCLGAWGLRLAWKSVDAAVGAQTVDNQWR